MIIRSYTSDDAAACRAVLVSNMPEYFSEDRDRADFDAFLVRMPGRYFVVETDAIVACGGWATSRTSSRVAVLTYGMVHRNHHRLGIGRALLRHRVDEIKRAEHDAIEIVTSQHTAPFFAREGFVVTDVQHAFFGESLDAHHMRRTFDKT